MTIIKTLLGSLTFLFTVIGYAQENVFLDREYWAANPSIEKIEKDISAGHDISELNDNRFDPLCFALLEKTDNATVKHLLDKAGNDVNKLTHDGRTYLMWAAYAENLDMVKYLVEKGAKADVKGSHGYNAINFAARGGVTDTKLYDFLMANGADLNDKTNNGANAILLVAPATTGYGMENDSDSGYKIIEYFAEKGLDINSADSDGNGIFNYAARGGDVALLKILVEKGLPYNTVGKNGGNAILLASQGSNNPKNGLETFKYLESLGLKTNITDKEGRNPLHAIASDSDDLKLLQYFIDKGVDADQTDKAGRTPFMNAATGNELEVVQFLSEYVKDMNAQDENGRSALTMAVNGNDTDVIEFLIKNGADVSVKDTDGNTLAYYLMNNFDAKDPEAFEKKFTLLNKKGLSLTEPQQNGNTLLHLATKNNAMALLKRLEDFNIDINKKNDEGNTALHLAAMTSDKDIVLKYLIDQGADKNAKTEFEESVYDLASENELLQKNQVSLEFLR